jgi:hypothetical protein
MTALPSNLAMVGEDLARATMVDARRSRRRRRLTTYALAFALLALTASAAVANGWLFGDETPVVRIVPALSGAPLPGTFAPPAAIAAAVGMTRSQGIHRAAGSGRSTPAPLGAVNSTESRTLLTGLGSADRSLSVVATTTGGVCVALSGLAIQCVPTFAPDQKVAWFTASPATGPAVVWGIVRDDVTGVDAIGSDGALTPADVANGAFYVELPDGPPNGLTLHLSDGASESVKPPPCPLTTPACTT